MKAFRYTIGLVIAFVAGMVENIFIPWSRTEYWSTIRGIENARLSEGDIARWNSDLERKIGSTNIKCFVVPAGDGTYELRYFNVSGMRGVPETVIDVATEISN